MTDAAARVWRLLRQDLDGAVSRTERGTWTTRSSVPHEIRLHSQAGVDLVRVSAGVAVDVRVTKALLETVNTLNVERAFSRRVVIDRKVLAVAEMPVASLRRGDLEQLVRMVLCTARIDAQLVAAHSGQPVTAPPPHLAPDLDTVVSSWLEVLTASGTATARELAVWLDDQAGCDCWIDRDEDSVIVALDGIGSGNQYPFPLVELIRSAEDLLDQAEDDDEEDE